MPVSYMEINLNALRHNLKVIRAHLPKEVNVLAVVKANAYGHGAKETLRIALEEGYVAAAVARVEEGAELRDAGFTCPIYVLGLPLPEDMPIGVNKDLIMPIDDTVDLDALEAIAAVSKKTIEVMLPIDTGMNRIGTHPEDVPALLKKLEAYPHIHAHGTFTHMATADHKEKDAALKQLDRFDEAISYMPVDENFVISSANSAGVIDIPRSWHNLARPGIIIYGPQPSDVMTNKLDLKYAMSVVSHVTHVQVLHKGEAIGYGGTYVAKEDMKTATVPIGMQTAGTEAFPIRASSSSMASVARSSAASAWISSWSPAMTKFVPAMKSSSWASRERKKSLSMKCLLRLRPSRMKSCAT